MSKTTALENLSQDADSQEISKIADGIYGGKGGITQEVKRLFIQLVLFDLRENGGTSTDSILNLLQTKKLSETERLLEGCSQKDEIIRVALEPLMELK